mmetsp:Transcript_51151/g.167196  ORF Transcript_51151/g.167196 Transcript_51151/m.167196 type:complete len:479 (-) Transcript_51151:153-1589(-)
MAAMLTLSLWAIAAARPLQVVFSAECNHLFDWHTAALVYSMELSGFGKTANLSRLLACAGKEREAYSEANLALAPHTFVHRNMRDDPLVDEKGYPSYNKPYSVMAWLAERPPLPDGEDEFVLMTDADMVFRAPVDHLALGAARGVVVSAEYTYLVGTESGFARRFLDESLLPRLAQVGGFHIFHAEDLRRIAPLWLDFTKKVRAFAHKEPDVFYQESMSQLKPEDAHLVPVRKKQSMWHSEMYGYVFAAATVGVTHRVRRDVMLYPGYEPFLGRAPPILHYGADYTLGRAYFNKMNYQQLRLEECSHALAKPSGSLFLLDDPEVDLEAMSKRDALCQEHLSTLNAAFCEFYTRACAGKLLPERCRTFAAQIDEVQPRISACVDEHENCAGWGLAECGKNPMYMHSKCPVTCQSCGKSGSELVPSEVHYGDWKYDERLQAERLQQVAEVVASASEEELVEIEGKVAARRTELRQIKHEL